MSKDEIKALIASSIEGQGNQVDVASKLATILNSVVDLLPEEPVLLTIPWTEASYTQEQMDGYGLTEEVFKKLYTGNIPLVKIIADDDGSFALFRVSGYVSLADDVVNLYLTNAVSILERGTDFRLEVDLSDGSGNYTYNVTWGEY